MNSSVTYDDEGDDADGGGGGGDEYRVKASDTTQRRRRRPRHRRAVDADVITLDPCFVVTNDRLTATNAVDKGRRRSASYNQRINDDDDGNGGGDDTHPTTLPSSFHVYHPRVPSQKFPTKYRRVIKS